MEWISWSLTILAVTGVAGLLSYPKRPGRSAYAPMTGWLGAGGCIAASVLGLWGAGGSLYLRQYESTRGVWNAPFASFNLGLDSLSALCLLPVFVIGGLSALAALRQLPGDYATNHPKEHWLFHNMTLTGAVLVVVARNAVLFLFAWEVMTVASFLLVENDQRAAGSRSGGWVYLTAGHIGGACLFAMFALLGAATGSLDFNSLGATGGVVTAVLLLAWAGFGGKMGLAPFQTWYPESYPPAPAHAGALLSGVIGNLGLYGLLRILSILGNGEPPPSWWGFLVLGSGLASGLIGAARSLAAKDLSRLLAWSSVENFGLMACGVGIGLLGAASDAPVVSFLGFAAAIVHMLNHSVSKALLFFSAGIVYARSGTRMLDRIGGLLKRLPLTGTAFFIGGLGAASVPPLNGFASEFLLLLSAYHGANATDRGSAASIILMAAIAVLALVGGLAVMAYVRAFGFVFLGNPRGPGAVSEAKEQRRLLLPHLILAALAVAIAVLSPLLLESIEPTAAMLGRVWRTAPGGHDAAVWQSTVGASPLDSAMRASWLLAGCIGVAFFVRFLLMRGKTPRVGPTWDCGYAAPSARMQYTSSSFVRPVVETFRRLIGITDTMERPDGLFPGRSVFTSSLPGVERAAGFSQLFAWITRMAGRIRLVQSGHIQLYLFYMALVLVALLLWKL